MAAVAKGVRSAARAPELDSFIVERCTITMRRHSVAVALDGEEEIMSSPLEYRLERDILRVVSSGETRET